MPKPAARDHNVALPTVRDAGAPSASSTDAAADAPDPLAACRASPGTPLDLGAVFDIKACRVGPDDAGAFPRLPHGVTARIEAPAEVPAGGTAVIHVVFDNRGDAPAEVRLEAETVFGLGGLGGPRPPPNVHPTWGFDATTPPSSPSPPWGDVGLQDDTKNVALGDDTGSLRARFVLAPSARAVATVLWGATDESGKPLSPGRYQVWIDLPVGLEDGARGNFVWIAVKR